MARILFAPETFNLGETTRAIEVARELDRMGHQVRFIGYSEQYASMIENAEFSFDRLEPTLSARDAQRLLAVDQGRGIGHPFTLSTVRRRVANEVRYINEWNAEAVVTGTMLTTFISARATRTPLAYVRPCVSSRQLLGSETYLPILSGDTYLVRRANALLSRIVLALLRKLSWKPAAFKHVAREYGVALPKRTIDALQADLNLICGVPLPDRSLQFDASEISVGPMFARGGAELDSELADLLAARKQPVIYVGMGSSAQASVFCSVLDQIAQMKVDVITGGSNYLSDSLRSTLPSNVHIRDHIPVERLRGRIDASVIHGGEGTVHAACALGVPFVGMGFQVEQRWNIEQCVRAGNALPFDRRVLMRGELPALIRRLLHDNHMKSRAHQIGGEVRAQNGARNAAEAIVTEFGL